MVETITGIALIVAVPLVFYLADYLKKRIPHGEARFDKDGKLIDDE